MAGSASASAGTGNRIVTNDNDGETRSATKFTRCRTGCLRCRKRRRKCDERKPRCQNCIDKNFDCSYGMQVTFLPKNSITVTPREIQSPRVDKGVSAKYNKIQFVNEDPLSINNLVDPPAEESQASSPASTGSGTALPLSPAPIPPKNEDERRHSTSGSVSEGKSDNGYSKLRPSEVDRISDSISRERYPPAVLPPWGLDNYDHRHNGIRTFAQNTNPVTLDRLDRPDSFSAKDESAVRGLLALGTQAGLGSRIDYVSSPVGNTGPETATEIGPGTSFAADTLHRAVPGFLDGILGVSSPTGQFAFNLDVGSASLYGKSESNPGSEAWKMKLLQHYRYSVAPWLDIHDLSHAFGITALQTAVNSSSARLLPSLLALSEACLRMQRGHGFAHAHAHESQAVRFDVTTTLYLQHPHAENLELRFNPDTGESLMEVILLRCFERLKGLVSDVAGAWANNADGYAHGYDYDMLRPLADGALGLDMDSAIYWMFLRMDIGRSLANNTLIHTPLPPQPIPSLALLCRTENTPQRVGHYAQVLLWLCGKALNAYHQDSTHEIHRAGPAMETESWLGIFEELNRWWYLCPQEFQPMVELSNDGNNGPNLNAGSEFPLLLFTNGAGALCNQLYHTAMLFMLECKPRTTALMNLNHSHHLPNAVLSPLWHAQRVCGIALNNDRRECWDPCLLASFLVAARHMTHESQQVEILRGFDRIQALTGWSVGEYLTQLREEWSFFDGE
ncbi:uncharacterized protein BDV17DRAFT_293102 [Aspergillus undulatus]|uniref:uncharacterized protein n=1 Tax=Aspergillus undulatus TaxID=1810928 RepID=UPI003CCCFEF8